MGKRKISIGNLTGNLTGILILLAAAVLLGGCSAYYRSGSGETEPPAETEDIRTETEGTTAGTENGPQVSKAEDSTVESLEIGGASANPEILIATDIHYLAKELTDFGEAFEDMAVNGDGKAVPYVWEITDAFLDAVVERKPQAVILCGDLTLEGERYSHEALASKLGRAERAGVDVVVIPGNHDINNSGAASYFGSSASPAEQTSPENFAEIYAKFGYEEAVSRDPASLSYVYQLKDGTWLLMLDSCQYEHGALVGGMIRSDTYRWIEEQLSEAWEQERNVIAVAHHNLFDESRIYEDDCTIEHAEELEDILDSWGVTLFLSGHLHVQHYKESSSYDIAEIVTGSLATAPCQYGVLKYFGPEKFDYHTETVDVASWAVRNENPDANLREFDTYANEFLQDVFYRKASDDLAGKDLTGEERRKMAEFYAFLNVYSVAGRAVEIRDWAAASKTYELWEEYNRSDILSMYIDEILEDAYCDYNTFQK